MESLEDTFIPEVFKDRTWTKLLNLVRVVYSKIIREFFSNATVEGDHIDCWKAQRINDHKGWHSRIFGDSSSLSVNLSLI